MAPLTGNCLCKSVTVKIKDDEPVKKEGLEVCHCTDCRQTYGGLAGMFVTADEDNVEITGDMDKYECTSDVGNTITRRRCAKCGGNVLFETTMSEGKHKTICAGLFPVGSLPEPSVEIFLKSAEPWYKPYPGAEAKQTM